MSDRCDRQEIEQMNSGEWPNPYDEDSAIEDAIGQDTFQAYLETCWLNYRRLRGTRDTLAIAASNANTRMLLDALKGHI